MTTGPQLGTGRDSESYGQPGAAADGDDNNGVDDEDGVSFGAIQVGQLDAIAIVTVQNAPAGAKLDAWIDFNGDGSWGGPGERIADSVAVAEGDNTVAFDVPSWASAGDSYERCRLSTAGGLAPIGAAADGEVEDYRVTVAGPAEASGMLVPRAPLAQECDAPTDVFSVDLDGDGDLDVLTAIYSDNKIAWSENDGMGYFVTHTITTSAMGVMSVFAADVDGDGDLDVLSACQADSKIAWYENDGAESFAAHTITTSADVAQSVYAADVDGDGDLDVLSASSRDDKIAWYENDGAENFAAHTITNSADQAESVFVADVDGDGDLDVLSASSRDDKIAWYENLGYDYGDAPAPYPTLRADDGARHAQTGPTLGARRDSETDGQPTTLADGDDLAGPFDDEDGLVNVSLLVRGNADAFVDVEISSLGYLNAWIDFDANGVWDTKEQIAIDMPVTAGVNRVPFAIPPGEPTDTYLRLRVTSYSTAGTLTPAGPADNGEVEDHLVTIRDAIHLDATSGDDVITVWPAEPNLSGTVHAIEINGTVRTFDADVVGGIFVHGLAGNDRITSHGTSAEETGTLHVGNVSLETRAYGVFADSIETVSIDAGMGNDHVTMTSATSSNRLYSYPGYSRMRDSFGTYSYRVNGFESVNIDVPAGGPNYAFLYDSSQNDVLDADPGRVVFDRMVDTAAETTTTISGFERVYVYATSGGTDCATLAGSDATANRLYGYPTYSTLTDRLRSFYHYARGFDSVLATGSETDPSSDRAYLYDSYDDDTLYGRGNQCYLEDTAGTTYHNEVLYFDSVYARSMDDDAATDDRVDVEDLAYYLLMYGSW